DLLVIGAEAERLGGAHRSDGGGVVLVEELALPEGIVCAVLGGLGCLGVLAHAEGAQDLLLDLGREIRVVLEELAGVLLALSELTPLVGEPGAGLADRAVLDAEVDQPGLTGVALAVEDVEFGLLEGRGYLVLDDL